ncbi:MAG: hypothetical protein GYA24_20005 [Candidatus Lokiarchaeota archaeon]|nr:hypothetical protein [Candidatus Lokiarchaeota archaeon]
MHGTRKTCLGERDPRIDVEMHELLPRRNLAGGDRTFCMALPHDEAKVFTGREDGSLFAWPLYQGIDPNRVRVRASIERMLVARDGNLVTLTGDGSIIILDEDDLHVVESLHGAHARGIFSGTFDVQGNVLYTGGLDGFVRAWHYPELVPITGTKVRKHGVLSLAMLPRGELGPLLIAGNVNGNISLLDPATLSEKRTFKAHDGPVFSIKTLPDGLANSSSYVSAGSDGSFAWWKADQPSPRARLHTGQAKLLDVFLQPAPGNVLAWMAGADGSIGAWLLEPGTSHAEQLACFHAHDRAVEQILSSTRGNCLLSVASDGSMMRMRLASNGTSS